MTSLDVSVSDVFSVVLLKLETKLPFLKLDGTTKNFRVTKLFGFFGLERREIQEAKAGDLIAISGMEDIFVGETITPTDAVEAIASSYTLTNQHFK